MEELIIKNNWNHTTQNVGSVNLHYVESGSGELVLLLHGFPDFWYSWRHQIPVLSDHFRIVAPDLRGYNKSDKPVGIDNYSTPLLVQDVIGLIDTLGETEATIVGHDWGGSIAWNLAMMAPTYVKKLVILNCPHTIPLVEAFWSMRFRQLQKSWYVFFFQLTEGPEKILEKDNYKMLKKMMTGSTVNKNTFREEDLEKYVEAWSQPGALTASINYYRANWNIANIMTMTEEQQKSLINRLPKVKCPTLVIWGEKDAALDKSLTFDTNKYIEGSYKIEYFPECGHWVHLEDPEKVNKSILSFLD